MQRKQEQQNQPKIGQENNTATSKRIKAKLDTNCNVTSQSDHSTGFPWSSGQMQHSHVAEN